MTFQPTLASRPLRSAALALGLACLLPAAMAQRMVSVSADNVNLRSGAGTQHAPVWTVARGFPLKVVGQRSGWLQVLDFEGDRSWVYARLTSRTPHMIVSSPTANVRGGPGTRHVIVGTANYGDVGRTLARSGKWVKLHMEPGGPTGWVNRRLLWGW